MTFRNRTEAGQALAAKLAGLEMKDPVVLALPRGGLPVALPVAERLDAPLDLLLVRKIGVPGHEELAAGAVVDGDAHRAVFNEGVLSMLRRTESDFAEAVRAKLREIEERRARYLGDRPPVPVAGRTAIVVDDGIATGATMKAALLALRAKDPARIVLAVPVAPEESLVEMRDLADYVICLETPVPFYAVGQHYLRFEQVGDDEVVAMMKTAPGAEERKDGT